MSTHESSSAISNEVIRLRAENAAAAHRPGGGCLRGIAMAAMSGIGLNGTPQSKHWSRNERTQPRVLAGAGGPAAPQGSMKNIARKGKKSMLIHSNKRTVSWRDEVGQAALEARVAAGYHQIFAGRHIAVGMSRTFCTPDARQASPAAGHALRVRRMSISSGER